MAESSPFEDLRDEYVLHEMLVEARLERGFSGDLLHPISLRVITAVAITVQGQLEFRLSVRPNP